MDEYQWIEGIVAVEAVLLADSREVQTIFVGQERFDGRVARLQQLAQSKGVPCSRVPAEQLAEVMPGSTASSVVANVGTRRMIELRDLLNFPRPVVFMLDGVEDPYNFGQAVRSLYAAGIDGLIVRPRNWLSAATVVRASAGATEFMPSAVAETHEAIAAARAGGLSIAVATAEGAQPMTEFNLVGPLLLFVGGEKRGVSRAVEAAADWHVGIPYGREVAYSLGTAAAAAVLAFEILRQRRAGR
ncbi:MAG: hypothetical protein KC410_09560 [Anaerolineales bacterium]|uniref:TrmH family RNA methyltransferase n=1 Tax=Promineifilum sp. TaxID=2664178 RepID=UPI001D580E4E|nr:hypothetical protein [Anaerolineales bacterium]MCB8934556.1 hypothetical protein [Promineifilum sp.]MCO5179064.1 RNA methyltransferase [Promineifilum sp.]